MNNTIHLHRISLGTFLLAVAAFLSLSGTAKGSVVDLGQAGQFALLALNGGIQDSGPTGPDANPYSVNGPVGVASTGQQFQDSGSRTYNGPIYLHSGDTYNNSAPGVPQPTMGPSVDSLLEQAKQDAFNASSAALQLGQNPTATFGTINNDFSITESSSGHYVFNINTINFSGGKALTLNAPGGSTYLLNVSSGLVLTPGSIVLAGGLTADNVLINYTGSSDIRFSGGSNSSRVFGTILAPDANVVLSPGFVAGSIIASAIQMSSGANVELVPVPEVTPSSVIFGFLGLLVAVSSRRVLAGRARAVSTQRNVRRG